jgi:hypothetical protein
MPKLVGIPHKGVLDKDQRSIRDDYITAVKKKTTPRIKALQERLKEGGIYPPDFKTK